MEFIEFKEITQKDTKRYYFMPCWLWEIDFLRPILRVIWFHKTLGRNK